MQSLLDWDWYRDPRVLDAEERLLFRPSWQYVGPLECPREPGDHIAGRIWRVPVVVLPAERLLADFQRYVLAACAGEVTAGGQVTGGSGDLAGAGPGERGDVPR